MRKGKRERLRRRRNKICAENRSKPSSTPMRIRMPEDYLHTSLISLPKFHIPPGKSYLFGLDAAKGEDLPAVHLSEQRDIALATWERLRPKLDITMDVLYGYSSIHHERDGYNGWRNPTPPPEAPLPTFAAPEGETLASSWADADSYFNKKSST